MVVRDIILVVAVLGVMVFGFFVMKRLDKFLDENRKRIEQEEKEKEPSCVMLTTDMTDEELIKNIRTYEKKRGDAYIILYQDEDELYDELFDGKR
jgi:DNA-binding LacI/PurR family transcriptional regulator